MFKSGIWWAVFNLLNSLAYKEFLNNNKNITDMFWIYADLLSKEKLS